MMILQGFVKGVRNVLAHIHGQQEEVKKPYEYLLHLFFAYALMRLPKQNHKIANFFFFSYSFALFVVR
ncbi:hypothetical protein Aazo_0036 ['Nostoc azollae' 0708]|jgi:hypothetical protein|uniref:Uncharacterized protein n=2 Tax=Trichormus azollae TaxID=1164 RepID=D7DVI1_NOSA0|nr:hypothetical protein Aazo_0036 ['Nostoc azollae' 0708]